MAPDIDALAKFQTDGYATDGVPRVDYEIPDIIMHAPTGRNIRVLSIGAGVTGIMNAYYIRKQLENVEHVIYEKNSDIGGTWLENRYPGCGCDIPSHAYSLPFALNPEWPRYASYSVDIWKYLEKICEVWDLRKSMHFNHEVIGCYWQQETGEWSVKIKETRSDGSTRVFDDRCHFLLHGTGILNNYKWPDIEGLDKFKGRVVHTARWPEDYQAEEWKNERVAVIGSGQSSVQTVPTMQPHVKHLDVFVRTAIWFVEIAQNYGQNYEYTAEERKKFHQDPIKLVEHAKSIEDQINGKWGTFYSNSTAQAQGKEALKARMAEFIKDERLLKGFTPTFGIGCRRIAPGDPYMLAIQKENVDVHFTPVTKVTEKTVIGEDGTEREIDTIVCATGFDVSYRPRFPIIGQNGVDLAEKWKVCPEGYLGLAIPDFPNFLTFIGPSWPIENGSVLGPLCYVSHYAMQMIKKVQTEYVRSIAPRQDVTDEFNEHCQEWVRHTVWAEDCRSWYKDNETGRVNAVWPGSSLHYIEAIRQPRYEDFEITYLGPGQRNRWAYLGMGTTRVYVEKGDMSPYLDVENLDVDWMRANNIDLDKVLETKIERVRKEWEQRLERGKASEAPVGNAPVG